MSAKNDERMKRKYEQINFRVYKGEKAKVLKYLEENHESMNGFINRLIADEIPDFEPMDTKRMNGWK